MLNEQVELLLGKFELEGSQRRNSPFSRNIMYNIIENSEMPVSSCF